MQRLTCVLLVPILFWSLTASAQTRRPIETNDLFAMQRISTPALSPDGRWVAYALTSVSLADNRSSTDLWLSPLDGTSPRQLTTHPASDRNPAWSPDGQRLAFESGRSGQTQIWILDLRGGEPVQFTMLSTGAAQPVWSPDGSMIAFISEVYPEFSDRPFRQSDSLNLAQARSRETSRSRGEVFARLYYRHWDSYVGGKRRHLFVQSVAEGTPRDLTPGDRDAVPTSSTFSAGVDFAFSPDGKEIAYTATPIPPQAEAWSTNHDIYTVPVAGGVPRQVTTNPAADGFPRYSPDGKILAYRAQSRPGYEADQWELILRDRTTGGERTITGEFDTSVESFCWSPDGGTLYLEAQQQARTMLFALSSRGGAPRPLVTTGTNHDLAVGPDGKTLVFSRTTATRPAEVYRCAADGSGLAPVTGANDQLFRSLEIPAPESFTYSGAGGTPVQAWLYRPPAFDPAKKYPLVLLIHGGPQGAWSDGWSYRWNPPLWAAQGYIVLAPNPRGSTGFGQAFTDGIRGDWGGKVFEDLMLGLEVGLRLPYADRERTAAAGASFGGYMVNWIQAQAPEHFKALVCHDGVYNFTSNYGTTEELWFDEWEHGLPWEDPERFERFSPHRYVTNFKTPQLVIHGELDYRVPVTEGMQMFTALQRRGVPSKFLYFPDEGHWVLKPANSALWHATVFAWLAEHLR
jgi:dipeptidyl aminopeptidase/acylaminoacyl peptidase